MKKVVILGSTGSIGQQALDVVRHLRRSFHVVGLVARKNWRLLKQQIEEFQPALAALVDPEAFRVLRSSYSGVHTRLLSGQEGVSEIVSSPDVQTVLSGITGAAGLTAGYRTVELGKTLALANKESMVMAGPVLLETARRTGATIVPVDSEHSAIFQALRCGRPAEVHKIILTASGGPFRDLEVSRLEHVTVEQALKHPTWAMGGKITIDSATLMNKALEIVEAKYLFDVPSSKIDVLIHPQSIVHSLVEFIDGSVMAQMGMPDMKVPIQYALTHPERADGVARRLDLARVQSLTFQVPDRQKFPSLDFGYRAAEAGGTMGAVMNAANEVAVEAFVEGRIRFPRIFDVVAFVMDRHAAASHPDLAAILDADSWARQVAREYLK